ARNRAILGGRASRLDLHAAVHHLRIGEHLVERVDRTGRNSDRLELGEQVVAPEGNGPGRQALDQRSAVGKPAGVVLVGWFLSQVRGAEYVAELDVLAVIAG